MSIYRYNQLEVTLATDDLRTPPESMVFGTAIRIGHGTSLSCRAFIEDGTCGMPSRHIAKAQKFKVLTGSACNNQGCFPVVWVVSMGSILCIAGSSETPSCHTSSLLSLP